MGLERRCMIIDDHPVLRIGVRRLLEPTYEIEELDDGREAVDLLTSVGGFEIAIVGMRPSRGNIPSGATTVRRLCRAQPGLGVVAYGGRIERHSLPEALDAGVEAASARESFVDPALDGRGRGIRRLTPRQRLILQLIADGLSTEEAARRLGVSAETIRAHAKGSLSRLEARDRAHAIAIAFRGALID